MKNKNKLLLSMLCVIVSCLAVAGTTFALNAESTGTGVNIVESGNIGAEVYVSDNLDFDNNHISDIAVFSGDKWEPGYTQVRYFKVVNGGSIAFSYNFNFTSSAAVTDGNLSEVLDVYYKKLDDSVTNANVYSNRDTFFSEAALAGSLNTFITDSNKKIMPSNVDLAADEFDIYAVAIKLRDDAPSSYKGTSINNFTVQLVATNQTSNS